MNETAKSIKDQQLPIEVGIRFGVMLHEFTHLRKYNVEAETFRNLQKIQNLHLRLPPQAASSG